MHTQKLILFIVIVLIYGCSTTSSTRDLQSPPVFKGTLEEAFEIARNSLLANGISFEHGSAQLGYVYGEYDASAWSCGERVTIYFRKIGDDKISFWVETKRKVATNILSHNWNDKVIDSIRQQIGYIKR